MPEVKQWRPKGWINPYAGYEEVSDLPKAHEAGASAMYEALLKELPEILEAYNQRRSLWDNPASVCIIKLYPLSINSPVSIWRGRKP